jgi:hypothetical protein
MRLPSYIKTGSRSVWLRGADARIGGTGSHAWSASHNHTARLLVLAAGLAAVAALGFFFNPWVSGAQAAIPPMTRSEIVARAESALGLRYTWGKESWIPNAGTGSGTDCSGLVLKCWEVPRTMLYQEEDGVNSSISPRYTSAEFYNLKGPWTALSSRSLLKEGDVLARRSGGSGHVVIYAGGDAWNSPIVYEAPGEGIALRRASRYISSDYRPIRRNLITETTAIILDNPTAKSIGGSDIGGNWTRSTSNAGYHGDNYQTRAGTTATAWARWTARFPTSGYYNVYLRWTSGSNRATNARVHVNTGTGQVIRTVNQRENGGTWNLLGRYYFRAGYATGAGSVSIFATGANGFVVADAVKFVRTN